MRKLLILSVFFVLTPLVMASCLLLLSSRYENALIASKTYPTVAYAALPPASGTLNVQIVSQDARITAVRDFFDRYNSDLLPYAEDVVSTADKYGLDYRLVPAIAMQESTLCKKAPKGSYNCWGFGIYGKKVTKFDNYKQAIDVVTKTLAQQYKANGLETPQEIMSKYTPSSNGSWADKVTLIMNRLDINL